MKKLFTGVLLLAFMFGYASIAVAQDEEAPAEEASSEPLVKYKEKTVYDFEDDTISGDLTKPDGEYLEARKRAKHRSLIKIRENFKEKVVTSVRKL